jgi:hypothetical protein
LNQQAFDLFPVALNLIPVHIRDGANRSPLPEITRLSAEPGLAS